MVQYRTVIAEHIKGTTVVEGSNEVVQMKLPLTIIRQRQQ